MSFKPDRPPNLVPVPKAETAQAPERIPQKEETMETFWELLEDQMSLANKLSSLAVSNHVFLRKMFETLEQAAANKGSLHEADELDESVEWLNKIDRDTREGLKQIPGAAEELRDELLEIVEEALTTAKEVFVISDEEWSKHHEQPRLSAPLIDYALEQVRLQEDATARKALYRSIEKLAISKDKAAIENWLIDWQRETEKLTRDSYAWARPRKELESGAAETNLFIAKRIERDLKRLKETYDRPSVVWYELLTQMTKLRSFVFARQGVTETEWSAFIAKK